jgi:4-alpha-glucanotransferase
VADETGEGAYISSPQQALFAVLAIEAARNRCLVIGEDLGNVPAGFRDEMADAGLYGCRLLYFHRTPSGAFTDPKDYGPATVASIGSHDLATLREWWDGTDLEEMEGLDVLSGDALSTAQTHRERDRLNLCDLLGLDPDVGFDTLSSAVHARLAQSGSDLVTAQIEMLLPDGARLNLPGTTTQYPNWRRKLPDVAQILSASGVRQTAKRLSEDR